MSISNNPCLSFRVLPNNDLSNPNQTEWKQFHVFFLNLGLESWAEALSNRSSAKQKHQVILKSAQWPNWSWASTSAPANKSSSQTPLLPSRAARCSGNWPLTASKDCRARTGCRWRKCRTAPRLPLITALDQLPPQEVTGQFLVIQYAPKLCSNNMPHTFLNCLNLLSLYVSGISMYQP